MKPIDAIDIYNSTWIALIGALPSKDDTVEPPVSGTYLSNGEPPPPFDEQEALKGLNKLDPQAITAIHTYYYPDIYRYVLYRINDTNIVEDLASEVFMSLLEAIHAGKGPRTTLRGWLMATTSNMVNSYYRKNYRRKTEERNCHFYSWFWHRQL